MPKELDRCVRQVMGKGHSESSAWVICRASTGMNDSIPKGPRLGVILAVKGRGYVHPVHGKFDISAKDLEQMVINFKHLGRPVGVYFGHVEHEMKSFIPAAAFVISMALHEDRVGGILEFSQEGWTQFQGGGFRGLSPELAWEAVDQKNRPIGTVFQGAAITNIPFLPGLELKLEDGKRKYRSDLAYYNQGVLAIYRGKEVMLEASETVVPCQFYVFVPGAGDKEKTMSEKTLKLLGIESEDEVDVKLEAVLSENKELKAHVAKVPAAEERIKSLENTVLAEQKRNRARDIRLFIERALNDGKGNQRLEPRYVEGYEKLDDEGVIKLFDEKLWFRSFEAAMEFATSG